MINHLLLPHLIEDHLIGLGSLILCICTVWAILTPYIKDGIIGKIILFGVALGSFGLFSKCISHVDSHHINEATLVICIAMYWCRHVWMAYVFRKVQRWYFLKYPHHDRRLNCRGCNGTNNDGTKRGRNGY